MHDREVYGAQLAYLEQQLAGVRQEMAMSEARPYAVGRSGEHTILIRMVYADAVRTLARLEQRRLVLQQLLAACDSAERPKLAAWEVMSVRNSD